MKRRMKHSAGMGRRGLESGVILMVKMVDAYFLRGSQENRDDTMED